MAGIKFKNVIMVMLLLVLFIPFVQAAEPGSSPVALVLGGGGARGAYQIGVWNALRELNIEIGAVYGVSAGAINGAVIAMDDYTLAERLWLELEKSNVMELNKAAERVLGGDYHIGDLIDAVKYFSQNDGISIAPLKELLELNLDEEKVRKSVMDYGLLTYSLSDFTEKYFYIKDIPEGELVDYILASAHLPVFQPFEVGGKTYLDGGFYRNLPVDMVDQRHFDRVIIVSLDMYSFNDIIDYVSDYSRYSFETVFIKPEDHGVSLLDFDPVNAGKLFEAGYNDCMRIMGEESGRAE